MVHALKEAWRVIKPFGTLIDLRPISIDAPLLIMTDSGWKFAGSADQHPDRVYDIAADRATRNVVHDLLFIRVKLRYFDINYYWNDLNECKRDIEGRWKDEIIILKETWQQARLLIKSGSGQRRVRIPFRKKITVYQKQLQQEAINLIYTP